MEIFDRLAVGCVLGGLGVYWVLGSLGVLGVLHGDLQLLLRQGSAPLQYNNVYWWTKIYLPEGQSYLCVLFHKMKWSFPR